MARTLRILSAIDIIFFYFLSVNVDAVNDHKCWLPYNIYMIKQNPQNKVQIYGSLTLVPVLESSSSHSKHVFEVGDHVSAVDSKSNSISG